MVKKSYSRLTSSEWEKIKAVLSAGLSVSEAAKFSKRTYNTVKAIKDSQNFADYSFIVKNKNTRNQPTKKVVKESNNESSSLKVLNEIANALWAIHKTLDKKKIIF